MIEFYIIKDPDGVYLWHTARTGMHICRQDFVDSKTGMTDSIRRTFLNYIQKGYKCCKMKAELIEGE